MSKTRDDESETSDSSSSLEVPYAMDLSISDNVDPIDAHDDAEDDNSESTGCGSFASPSRSQREPLRAGDVIRYTNPAFTARHAQGSRVAQILSVDPEARDFPLVLDNCELLPTDTFLRRVGEMYKGQIRPHKGRSKVLSSFLLKKTWGLINQDALQKQMLLRAGTFKGALKQIEKDAMNMYRTGSVPKKNITTQPQMGIFPAAIIANGRRRHSKSSSTRLSKVDIGMSSRTTKGSPTETVSADATVRRSKHLSMATSSLLDSPVKPAVFKKTTTRTTSFEKRENHLKRPPPSRKRSLLGIAMHPSLDDSTSSEDEFVVTFKSSISSVPIVRQKSILPAGLVAKRKSSPPPSPTREGAKTTASAWSKPCSTGSESVDSRYDATRRRNNGTLAESSSSNMTNWRSKDTTRGKISNATDGKATTLDTTSAYQQSQSSILDIEESDDDKDDDDDDRFLWTQNVPFYTEYRPKIPPAHRNTRVVNTGRMTSSLSFSKQNNKTTTTPVASKATDVQNPVPGKARPLAMVPAASRPLAWNSAKSPSKVASTPRDSPESPLSHDAVTTFGKKQCSKIASASAPRVSDDRIKNAVLGLLCGFSEIIPEGTSKLTNDKTKSGVPHAPKNRTTLDEQHGLEDNESSEEDTSGSMVRMTRAESSDSSSDDEKLKKNTTSSSRAVKTSEIPAQQHLSRMTRTVFHDAADTPVLNDVVVVKEDTSLGKPSPRKLDSDILRARPPASTKPPTTMDGVTRRYQDLIASDSDDDGMARTGRSFRNARVEVTGKDDSQEVVVDGDKAMDCSANGGPARYFLPPSARRTPNGSAESKYAKRQSKRFLFQDVKSVLESATPHPRTKETPTPSKNTGNLSLFSSIASSPTPLKAGKAGKVGTNARKRKTSYDSVSDDTLSQRIRRLSKAKEDITSSWSTDCEVDSPPSSPPKEHLRSLSPFRSKQDTKRCRGNEPRPFIASSVFDFVDETSPGENRTAFGNKAGPQKKTIRVL